MCVCRAVLILALFLTDLGLSHGNDLPHHSLHKLHAHKFSRRHRATNNDGELRFEPVPYSKKLEQNSSGKIHCKVAGGTAPNVQWFLNANDSLPEGVTSSSGTLLFPSAAPSQAGQYTCRATEGDKSIEAKITVDIVVSPRIIEPTQGQQVHVLAGQPVYLHCRATGNPRPTTHWDRNITILHPQNEVDVEDGVNAFIARIILLHNGTLYIRNATEADSDRYGCTAGSAAGLARNELDLIVLPEGSVLPSDSPAVGVGGKAVVVSISVAAAYMVLVLALMLYCRRRRRINRDAAEKLELEMAEGREKLVEEGEEDKKVSNGAPVQNGRLLPHDKDSGADNSEVSGVSRASKKSGQYDHLSVSRSLLTEQITLGRGEFGDVILAKVDMSQLKKIRSNEVEPDPKVRPVLVKMLTTKDETQLAEFRRQLELFSRVRHANVVRLIGLCNQTLPHAMLLQHTDWGDLKSFLLATRTAAESAEYAARVGASPSPSPSAAPCPPLAPAHLLLLTSRLAHAGAAVASHRLVHKDIAARNCVITSQLNLKLSYPALTKGNVSYEYYKLHDQVIPLRWLPAEAVLEGEYSTKSDVYMFAATVWEMYTKAELPFAKLNDNSVMERIKSNSLEWTIPANVPDKMAELLKRCWSKSPADRPQFSEICEQINVLIKDVTAESSSQKSQEKIDEL